MNGSSTVPASGSAPGKPPSADGATGRDRRSLDRHRQPEAGEPRGAEPSPRAVPAGALLELGEFQDFADLAPELGNLAAGYGLRYRVRPELDGDADAGVRAGVNERLAGISADPKVE